MSSEMLRRSDWEPVTNISEKSTASILKVEENSDGEGGTFLP
jgi:hypothetical protein